MFLLFQDWPGRWLSLQFWPLKPDTIRFESLSLDQGHLNCSPGAEAGIMVLASQQRPVLSTDPQNTGVLGPTTGSNTGFLGPQDQREDDMNSLCFDQVASENARRAADANTMIFNK